MGHKKFGNSKIYDFFEKLEQFMNVHTKLDPKNKNGSCTDNSGVWTL